MSFVLSTNKPTVVTLTGLSNKLENIDDLDPLIDYMGDACYVLLGEASHGTHEYYKWRMEITKRLIEEKGFSFVAVEGDWPDCYRINRYIKGYSNSGEDAHNVLHEFKRWPTWMWANWEMVAFTEWLRKHNDRLEPEQKVGFYGLDVYSLYESLEFIIDYLKQKDPEALQTARQAMKCFAPYSEHEGQDYASATALVPHLCEKEVVSLLQEIRKKMAKYNTDPEAVFSAEQNAFIAVNAEKYYNAMVRGGAHSWNIRDRHMVSTLERLMEFHGNKTKTIIWEHNTHIGDARATDMAAEGMVNVGQLITEKHAESGVVLVGFGSYKGTVIAGRHWGDVMKKINVPPAKEGSLEHLLHLEAPENKFIWTSHMKDIDDLNYHIDHRAIGVVYNPEYEIYGNYVPSIIPMRYDVFIFLNETTALHPLHIRPDGHQIPETYPFGF